MTLLQTDSPQQIFLVTYLMIVPSSPHNLIIIAISNSNLSDCSFQLLLPVITFSHTVISLEFSLCKGTWTLWASYVPVFFMKKSIPSFTLQGIFSIPQIIFILFPSHYSITFFTLLKMWLSKLYLLYTEVSFHYWELHLTHIRRKAFLYYHSISLRGMVIYRKKTVIYNTSFILNIDLPNCIILYI